MKKSLKSNLRLAAASLMFVLPAAMACSSEEYIGSICYTAASFCPDNFLEARGQPLNVNTYMALYSLLSNTYGGDGRTTFNLPDLQGRTPVGFGQGAGLANITMGQKRGAETNTITVDQMPVHTHPVTIVTNTTTNLTTGGQATLTGTLDATTGSGDSNVPSAANNQLGVPGAPAPKIYAPSTGTGTAVPLKGVKVALDPAALGLAATSTSTSTPTVGTAGGGHAMNNVPPQLGLRACIAVNGIYPPRP